MTQLCHCGVRTLHSSSSMGSSFYFFIIEHSQFGAVSPTLQTLVLTQGQEPFMCNCTAGQSIQTKLKMTLKFRVKQLELQISGAAPILHEEGSIPSISMYSQQKRSMPKIFICSFQFGHKLLLLQKVEDFTLDQSQLQKYFSLIFLHASPIKY